MRSTASILKSFCLIGWDYCYGVHLQVGEFWALRASFQLSLLLHKIMAGCIRLKKEVRSLKHGGQRIWIKAGMAFDA